jgi:rhodanese-related sulfurtransferase
MTRRILLAGAFAILAAAGGHAQSGLSALSAREAHDGALAGQLVIVDIRTPAEWADTGVPQGALRLDAEASGFELRLAGLRVDYPGKRIVLIDRSGGLSASTRQKLAGRGWRDLGLVRGGMLGSASDKGWLAEGLPVVSYP